MGSERYNKVIALLTVVLFAVILWLPNVESLVNFMPPVPGEKKRSVLELPAPWPHFSDVKKFQGKFVRFFIDNFGFRKHFIRWNSLFKLKVLRTDQFPKVLIGSNEWLYLIKDDDDFNVFDYYRSPVRFTEAELKEWVKPIREINDAMKKRGVRYLLVFVPMKTTVYPEYIPSYLHPVTDYSPREEIKKYLREKTDIDFVDLTGAVIEARSRGTVFFKHDVHWSGEGAFAGYGALMEKLSSYYPGMKAQTEDRFSLKKLTAHKGDLSSMLGLADRFSETVVGYYPKDNSGTKWAPPPYEVKTSRLSDTFETPSSQGPRAVVFHDSFFNFMKIFVPMHFRRMACFQSYNRVDLQIVDREKPDIVINEMVECYIQKTPSYLTIMKEEKRK